MNKIPQTCMVRVYCRVRDWKGVPEPRFWGEGAGCSEAKHEAQRTPGRFVPRNNEHDTAQGNVGKN